MKDLDFSIWIEHLKDPLVLIGFVIVVISGILKKTIEKQITSRLAALIVRYSFSIGLLVVVLGFALAFIKQTEQRVDIDQKTKDVQSPVIITGEGSPVTITYGDHFERKETNQADFIQNKTQPNLKNLDIEQHTEGKQSPAVISGGDVNMNY